MKVKEIMNKEFLYVKEEDTDKKVNGTPVMNNNMEISGIVVKADIFRFLMEPGHYDSYPISAVMTTNLITAEEEEEVEEAALRLRKNNIIALPVINDKKALGLISLENIVDYFLKGIN